MKFICSSCSKNYSLSEKVFRCTCGGFLRVESPNFFPKKDLDRRDHSIWRYREGFGLPEDVPSVSLGEGRTSIIAKRVEGVDLAFKLDYLQPSGSFKDRGASVLLSLAKSLGVSHVVEDSSGNAGAAVSAYAAAAGIRCTVYVPGYTPEGKLMQMKLYGSEVVKVPGKRQEANRAVIEAAQKSYYASHLWNPFFVMGLQSAAFEIWEQYGGHLPPRVVVPIGGGGFLEGLHAGFAALRNAGYVKEIPRLIGVQADNCPPIHQAFQEGLPDFKEMEVEVTVAEGIAVQKPPRGKAVLQALRESGGWTVGVSEEEILSAERILFSLGLFVEPTSAAAMAAWRKLRRGEQEKALIILTGNGLKETQKLSHLFLGY
jgi:threonine synthase